MGCDDLNLHMACDDLNLHMGWHVMHMYMSGQLLFQEDLALNNCRLL
jgi:hypothetical protein